MTILVTGARGAVGRGVLHGLLAAGVAPSSIRAGGRDPSVLALPDGVVPVAADVDAPDTMDLDGVEAVFCYAGRSLEGFAAAARTAGVGHVVLLSSESVLEPEPNAIARHHAECEQALRGAGLTVTALRPGAFAGNVAQWLPGIREAGVVDLPYPRTGLAPIHEQDIADVAVAALTSGAGRGEDVHPTGPESMTMSGQVDILARELDREIGVREVDPDATRERMSAHMPAYVVDALFAYWSDYDGRPAPVTDEVSRLAGHPARPFAQWVGDRRDELLDQIDAVTPTARRRSDDPPAGSPQAS